jgi:STE24 endopeptidase
MRRSGELWWLYTWLAWVASTWCWWSSSRRWIAPLFNRFTPLEDGELRRRIEALLARCGFSRLGPVRDGRLEALEPRQRLLHRLRRARSASSSSTRCSRASRPRRSRRCSPTSSATSGATTSRSASRCCSRSLGLLVDARPADRRALVLRGAERAEPATAMAAPALRAGAAVPSRSLQPLTSLYSRRHEFEADAYAATHASAADLASALAKLYQDNAATLTPDPLHSAFYDSHPPAARRIARLQAGAQEAA